MKLTGHLNLKSIRLLRGTVDVYKWRGMWVARAWPTASRQPGTPPQQKTWQGLRDTLAWIRDMDATTAARWRNVPLAPTQSRTDLLRKIGLRASAADVLAPAPRYSNVFSFIHPPTGRTGIFLTWLADYAYTPDAYVWVTRPQRPGRPAWTYEREPHLCIRKDEIRPRYRPVLQDYVAAVAVEEIYGGRALIVWMAGLHNAVQTIPAYAVPGIIRWPARPPIDAREE